LFDIVGNVREWIFNEVNDKKYIFGGGVKDPGIIPFKPILLIHGIVIY